jgi:ABC-type Co2+ transport system permease subunit
MTMTQVCILAWAVAGLIVVAGLLRFLGPSDERRRETRN